MGSSIGRIYDDYKDYQHLCEFLKIESLGIRVDEGINFYQHEEQILKEHNVTTHYELYQKLKS